MKKLFPTAYTLPTYPPTSLPTTPYRLTRSFTLIELLLYTGLLAGILLMISLFLFTITEAKIKNRTISEVEQQSYQALEQITQIIRNSSSITSPLISTNGNSLTLATTNPTKNPTIINLNNGRIQIQEGASSPIYLTTSKLDISDLSFQNLSQANTKGTIRITFSTTYINLDDRNEFDFNKDYYASASLR